MAPKTSTTTTSDPKRDGNVSSGYMVHVSMRFVVLSLLSSVLLAFAVGRVARVMLLEQQQRQLQQDDLERRFLDANNDGDYTARTRPHMAALPDPVMMYGKVPPRNEYTSKTFDTTMSSSTQSRWVVTKVGEEQCVHLPHHECDASSSNSEPTNLSTSESSSSDQGAQECSRGKETCVLVEDDDDDDDEVHLPAGQHLLIDIEHVDSSFLNDEERLARAMLALVDGCGLTLLSYHCHKLIPMGVSCAGVLLESHVSFHTWPKEGVITLDLYTCGPTSLVPILPLAEKLFSIPRKNTDAGDATSQPNMVWAHKYRGFYNETTMDEKADLIDLQSFPLGMMTDYKKEVSR